MSSSLNVGPVKMHKTRRSGSPGSSLNPQKNTTTTVASSTEASSPIVSLETESSTRLKSTRKPSQPSQSRLNESSSLNPKPIISEPKHGSQQQQQDRQLHLQPSFKQKEISYQDLNNNTSIPLNQALDSASSEHGPRPPSNQPAPISDLSQTTNSGLIQPPQHTLASTTNPIPSNSILPNTYLSLHSPLNRTPYNNNPAHRISPNGHHFPLRSYPNSPLSQVYPNSHDLPGTPLCSSTPLSISIPRTRIQLRVPVGTSPRNQTSPTKIRLQIPLARKTGDNGDIEANPQAELQSQRPMPQFEDPRKAFYQQEQNNPKEHFLQSEQEVQDNSTNTAPPPPIRFTHINSWAPQTNHLVQTSPQLSDQDQASPSKETSLNDIKQRSPSPSSSSLNRRSLEIIKQKSLSPSPLPFAKPSSPPIKQKSPSPPQLVSQSSSHLFSQIPQDTSAPISQSLSKEATIKQESVSPVKRPSKSHRRYAQRHKPFLQKSPSPSPEISHPRSPASESSISSPQPPSPTPEYASSSFRSPLNFQQTLGFQPSSDIELSSGTGTLQMVQNSSDHLHSQPSPLVHNLNYPLPRFTPHIFDSAIDALQSHCDILAPKIPPPQKPATIPKDKPKKNKRSVKNIYGYPSQLKRTTRYVTGLDGKPNIVPEDEEGLIKITPETYPDHKEETLSVTINRAMAPGEPLRPETLRPSTVSDNILFKANTIGKLSSRPNKSNVEISRKEQYHPEVIDMINKQSDHANDENESSRRFRHSTDISYVSANQLLDRNSSFARPSFSKKSYYQLPQIYRLHFPFSSVHRSKKFHKSGVLGMPQGNLDEQVYPSMGPQTRYFSHSLPDNTPSSQNFYMFKHGGHSNHMYNTMYRLPVGGRSLNGRWKKVSKKLSKKKLQKLRVLQQKKRHAQQEQEEKRLKQQQLFDNTNDKLDEENPSGTDWKTYKNKLKKAIEDFRVDSDESEDGDDEGEELLNYPGLTPEHSEYLHEPRGPHLRQQLAALNATAGGVSSSTETGFGSGFTSRAARRWFLHPLSSSSDHSPNLIQRSSNQFLQPSGQDVPTVFHASSAQLFSLPLQFKTLKRRLVRETRLGQHPDEDDSCNEAADEISYKPTPRENMAEFIQFARDHLGMNLSAADMDLIAKKFEISNKSKRSREFTEEDSSNDEATPSYKRPKINESEDQSTQPIEGDDDFGPQSQLERNSKEKKGAFRSVKKAVTRLEQLDSLYTSYQAFAAGNGPRRDYLFSVDEPKPRPLTIYKNPFELIMKKKKEGVTTKFFGYDDEDDEETQDEDETPDEDEIYENELNEDKKQTNVNRSVLKHELTRNMTIDLGTHTETRQHTVATPDSQLETSSNNGPKVWGPIYYNHPELPFRAGLCDALYGARFLSRHDPLPKEEETVDELLFRAASFASGSNTGNNVPDLLQTLHLYAAELYEALGYKQAFMSMDETALLGLGVVVEEYMKSLVGREGHRMYAEREKSEMEEYLEDMAIHRREQEKQEASEVEVGTEAHESTGDSSSDESLKDMGNKQKEAINESDSSDESSSSESEEEDSSSEQEKKNDDSGRVSENESDDESSSEATSEDESSGDGTSGYDYREEEEE